MYSYTRVVKGFLEKNSLKEKDFSEAISIAREMDRLNEEKWKLVKGKNLSAIRLYNNEVQEIVQQVDTLGRKLVKQFSHYPSFQKSIDFYRWYNPNPETEQKAIDGTLELNGPEGSSWLS